MAEIGIIGWIIISFIGSVSLIGCTGAFVVAGGSR